MTTLKNKKTGKLHKVKNAEFIMKRFPRTFIVLPSKELPEEVMEVESKINDSPNVEVVESADAFTHTMGVQEESENKPIEKLKTKSKRRKINTKEK